MVLVEGAIGSGKTRLLADFGNSVAADAVLLQATCFAAERDLPLGTIRQLLCDDRFPPGLADRLAELPGQVAPMRHELRHCYELVSAALRKLAKSSPVVIAVDDLQYVDLESLHCLLYLTKRCQRSAVLTVLTSCPDLQPAHHEWDAKLSSREECRTLRLEPLTEAEVWQLLAGPERHSCAGFYATTGGNPLLLRAVLDDHRSGADPRIGSYAHALLGCLHRLGAGALRIARAAAVLDDGASSAEIGHLTGLDETSVARGLAALTASGVLADGRLRHPAAAGVVLDELVGQYHQEYADLQLAAARLRHEQGAPVMTVASHLVLAGQAEPWQVETLIEASEQSLLVGSCELAGDALKLAYECCTDERERATVQARLALVEWRTNISLAVRHLPALAEAAGSGKLALRETVAAVRQLLWHGRVQDAGNALAVARTSVGAEKLADSTVLCDTERWLAFTYPLLAEQTPPLRSAGPHSVMDPNLDPWLRATGTMSEGLLHGHADAAVYAVQVLGDLKVGNCSFWAEEAATLALLTLICADRVDEAADWADALCAAPDVAHAATRQAILAGIRAEIAVRQGDTCAAREHGEAALAALPLKSWGVAAGLPLGALIQATTIMGDTGEAAKLLARSVPDTMFSSRNGLHYLYARGRYHLATNHVRAALADFLSCGEIMRTWGIDIATLVPWRVGAAEAWLALNNRDRARSLIYDQLARLHCGSRVRAVSLRLLAATSSSKRRTQLLAEAAEAAEAAGDHVEQAKALGDLSRAYQDVGDSRRARLLSRRALHVANTCGAAPLARDLLADSTEGAIVPSQQGHGRLTTLTSSELRVASLAVMGYTNREIASRLYVTPSTVEQHLTKVYRKLDVSSRKDLPLELWRKPPRQERHHVETSLS